MAKKIKAHSLTGRITTLMMAAAFRNVKRNRGAAGIDKVSIQLFENNLQQNLLALMRCLKNGTYQSQPLRRVHIPKGDGKTRPLGILLKAGVMEDGVFTPTSMGTPQGGVISPLLANIALNSLDWRLHDAGFRFVRYADDFVVLGQSQAQVNEAHALVQLHLTQLGLALSPEKTKLTPFREGFSFLGFAISSWSVTMRPKSVEKFKTKIRELTIRSHNLDHTVVMKVNQVVRGTANYFATAFSNVRDLFRRLDRWIRMRIRCMKFKRKQLTDNWRIKRKHLRNLGFTFLSDVWQPPAVRTT